MPALTTPAKEESSFAILIAFTIEESFFCLTAIVGTSSLVKETYPLLENTKSINFVGNVEARDILTGDYDVVVCDGFSGNIALKTIEGTALTVMRLIKNSNLQDIPFFDNYRHLSPSFCYSLHVLLLFAEIVYH